MSPNQLSSELKDVLADVNQYLPSKSEEDRSNDALVNQFVSSTRKLSDRDRYTKFSLTRIELYESIVDDLGHLPPTLILKAVQSAAAAIRILAYIEDSETPPEIVFHQIRALGAGIAAAAKFNSERDRVLIGTYTSHPHIKELVSAASPGDHFFFNALCYATGKPPFNGIPVTPVVDHYFSRIRQAGEPIADIDALALALELTAKDIFGNESQLLGRVSQRPKQTSSIKWPLFSVILVLLLIWLMAN